MPNPREMAEAVARWMGWTVIKKGVFSIVWQPPHNDHPTIDLPDYADSLDAMREVEDEIERRGLWREYATRLEQVVGVTHESTPQELRTVWLGWIWLGARATAAQRLEAAARVIEEASHA